MPFGKQAWIAVFLVLATTLVGVVVWKSFGQCTCTEISGSGAIPDTLPDPEALPDLERR